MDLEQEQDAWEVRDEATRKALSKVYAAERTKSPWGMTECESQIWNEIEQLGSMSMSHVEFNNLFFQVLLSAVKAIQTIDQVTEADAWDRNRQRITKMTNLLVDVRRRDKTEVVVKPTFAIICLKQALHCPFGHF